METAAIQKQGMSDGIYHVGRNENVTILATLQYPEFFIFGREVVLCSNVSDR